MAAVCSQCRGRIEDGEKPHVGDGGAWCASCRRHRHERVQEVAASYRQAALGADDGRQGWVRPRVAAPGTLGAIRPDGVTVTVGDGLLTATMPAARQCTGCGWWTTDLTQSPLGGPIRCVKCLLDHNARRICEVFGVPESLLVPQEQNAAVARMLLRQMREGD